MNRSNRSVLLTLGWSVGVILAGRPPVRLLADTVAQFNLRGVGAPPDPLERLSSRPIVETSGRDSTSE